MNKSTLYQKRIDLLTDAISLHEPSRVPVMGITQGYPVIDSGYSMKDAIYDFSIADKSVVEFATHYNPDIIWGFDSCNYGKGQALELAGAERLVWAGKPNGKNGDNSIHQVLDFNVLTDDEFELFDTDYTGWVLQHGYPRVNTVLTPFSSLYSLAQGPSYDISALASECSTQEFRTMMESIWKINDINQKVYNETEQLEMKLNQLGYLTPVKGYAAVPMDDYGAYLRSAADSLTDIYENTDSLKHYLELNMEFQRNSILAQGDYLKGKMVIFYLTKACDSFMSNDCFKTYYWKYLQEEIELVLKYGMIPYIYTEGPVNSRLEFFKDVPSGVVYNFESSVDLKVAKKVVGESACISGGFPLRLLMFGTKQEVIDYTKELIDTCAPGGGYIFGTEAGYDEAIHENVEVMFETALEYGKK